MSKNGRFIFSRTITLCIVFRISARLYLNFSLFVYPGTLRIVESTRTKNLAISFRLLAFNMRLLLPFPRVPSDPIFEAQTRSCASLGLCSGRCFPARLRINRDTAFWEAGPDSFDSAGYTLRKSDGYAVDQLWSSLTPAPLATSNFLDQHPTFSPLKKCPLVADFALPPKNLDRALVSEPQTSCSC